MPSLGPGTEDMVVGRRVWALGLQVLEKQGQGLVGQERDTAVRVGARLGFEERQAGAGPRPRLRLGRGGIRAGVSLQLGWDKVRGQVWVKTQEPQGALGRAGVQ